MTQFGAGQQFSAQCPPVPVPDGWRPWTDADGPVPDALAQRATAMVGDPNASLGATESFPLPGVTALLRVEPRVWVRDPSGNLMEGCWRAGAVYLPARVGGAVPAPPAAGASTTTKVITTLTVVSLAVGTAATLASWGKR